MSIIDILKKYKLIKNSSMSELRITEINTDSPITRIEDIYYDDIVSISDSGFIDTTSTTSIQKYKSNLRNLVEQVKKNGAINSFKSIRNDDYFPFDNCWSVASPYTCVEMGGSNFTYELRKAFIEESIHKDGKSLSDRFITPKEYESARKKLPKYLGFIESPSKFRSTKHFTVNTPLGYTGEYNMVDPDRNFTIIDDLDVISNSGYAYSISYFDAYLDITHENLPLSKNVIILIEDDKYNEIIKNPVIMEQLKNKRVIRYKGDQSVAINMILSELGVLPYRPGNMYYEYDQETRDILDRSIRSYCSNSNIPFNLGHGNINGIGGHFSDNLDTMKNSSEYGDEDFVDFMKIKYPNYSDLFEYGMTKNEALSRKIINLIGVNELLIVIEEFNQYILEVKFNNLMKYKYERNNIDEDTRKLFQDTLKIISLFYNNEINIELSEEDIGTFFHSYDINEQIDVSKKILSIYNNDVHMQI